MLSRQLYTVCSVCCEQGDLRPSNQDRVLARQGTLAGRMAGLFLVADGCGGLAYGEKISHLAVESFQRIWEEELEALLLEEGETGILPALTGWAERINAAAYAFGERTGKRVGSTLTLLLTLDRRYFILHTGDSRAYLLRKRRLTRLTEDQSLVADMLRNGELTAEEAEDFAHKNVLTMCLGCFRELRVFRTQGKLRRGDLFLLCSDGLYRALEETELAELLPRQVEMDSAQALRQSIARGEAKDNVSIVLAQILQEGLRR